MDILISDEAPSGFDLSLTVPEGFRRDLLPAALAAALSRASMPTDSLIQIWIEDAQMDDDDLLNRIGFSSYRDLWQMRCKFPPNGEGISTRPFICGVDDEAFLEVNSRAFSWHPEQGSLDTQKLNNTLKEEWFERSLTEFGNATGVAATGLLLLRLADPRNLTNTLPIFSIKQLFLQPLLSGGLITVMAPFVVIQLGLKGWTEICGLFTVIFIVIAFNIKVGFYFRNAI